MSSDRRQNPRVTVYRAKDLESGEPWEVEYHSIAEALHFACRDLREGRRSPIEIAEDGAVVYDAEGLVDACAEHDARHQLGAGDEA